MAACFLNEQQTGMVWTGMPPLIGFSPRVHGPCGFGVFPTGVCVPVRVSGAGTAHPRGAGAPPGAPAPLAASRNKLLVCSSYSLGLIGNVSSAISLNKLFWCCIFYI